MQTIIAHFEDPQSPAQAARLLRTTVARRMTGAEINQIYPNVAEEEWKRSMFAITLPITEALRRLSMNVNDYGNGPEGEEEVAEFVVVHYRAFPPGMDPGPALMPPTAAAAAGRRKTKKKRLMSKSYCKKTSCRKMGFTQKASCRPYKNCY
jgi:hypothetical protein